jgi:hypothetical protein
MGVFGSIGRAIGGAIDSVSDAVVDVAGSIGSAAESVASTVADAAVSVGGYAGDAGSAILNVLDDTVFDTVDFVTGGLVDFDFDDGNFSVNLGLSGLGAVGVSIGEDGLNAAFDVGLTNVELGISGEGFSVSGSAGIDFGPLPYAEGHVSVSADGDVLVNGRVQGTVPTPLGLLSGQANGGFVRTDEGWGAFIDADGRLLTPEGTTITGGLQAGYYETDDGSRTTLGLQGSVSKPGVGSAGGSVGYQRIEQDGNVMSMGHASGYAEGFGIRVDAEGRYLGIETEAGSMSQWSGDVDIKGFDADSLRQLGQSLLGFDDDVVTGVLGQAAEQGALGALLGNLDTATTQALVGRLLGTEQPAAPEVAAGAAASTMVGAAVGGDDVAVGVAVGVTVDGPGLADPGLGGLPDDPLQDGSSPDDALHDDALQDDPVFATDAGAGATGSPAEVPEDTGFDEPAPAPAAPVDDFTQSLDTADAVQDGFDDMFDDIGG